MRRHGFFACKAPSTSPGVTVNKLVVNLLRDPFVVALAFGAALPSMIESLRNLSCLPDSGGICFARRRRLCESGSTFTNQA